MGKIMGQKILVVVCLVLLLSSCSMFGELAGEARISEPEVDFVGGKLSKLSFSRADFLFDLRIRNPNALGLKMAGFDYDFLIDEISFVKGKQERGLEIEAKGASTVQIPVSLGFVDLYQTFQNLMDQDVSTYHINCSFSFDVPVLGAVSVPVSKSGEFPLLKLPKVSLDALELDNLTLSGAKLKLRIGLTNPNAFSMILERLRYQFEVNETRWVSGDAREGTQIIENGEGFIEIPIFLDFLEMGRAVYQLLQGDASLSYQFGGNIDLTTSLPLLDQVSLPFDLSGQTRILR